MPSSGHMARSRGPRLLSFPGAATMVRHDKFPEKGPFKEQGESFFIVGVKSACELTAAD